MRNPDQLNGNRMAGTGIAPDPGMNLFRLPAGSHHEVIRIPFKNL